MLMIIVYKDLLKAISLVCLGLQAYDNFPKKANLNSC